MTGPGDRPPLTRRAPRVLAARALHRSAGRSDAGAFLAEGPQAVREALREPSAVREVFATAASAGRHTDLLGRMPVTLVDDQAMALLSDTVTPSGLVAVCGLLDVPLADVLGRAPRLVVVLVDTRDPGNAGTVLRTADAAGADAVVFAGSTVDPYNGKVVRASAGSLFHLPVVRAGDALQTVAALREAGLRVLAAAGSGERDVDELAAELTAPTAWLLGNEAHGLPADVAAAADARVRVPIHGRAESLNLAVAAAVLLYATARAQRSAS